MIGGVDPGSASGSYTFLTLGGAVISQGVFKDRSPHDFARALRADNIGDVLFTWVEKVGPMPGQGIVSAFSFAKNAGMIEGVLAALEKRYEIIPPREWQKLLGVKPRVKKNRKKGIAGESKSAWKNRLRVIALRLFPQRKITLITADSLLIAEAARREYLVRISK